METCVLPCCVSCDSWQQSAVDFGDHCALLDVNLVGFDLDSDGLYHSFCSYVAVSGCIVVIAAE